MTTPDTTAPSEPGDAALFDDAPTNATVEVADDMPPETSEEWSKRMMRQYGDCPDDLPDRQRGQSDAEYRGIAEAHMEAATAAAKAAEMATQRPADEQNALPGTPEPAETPGAPTAPETVSPAAEPTDDTGEAPGLVDLSTAGEEADGGTTRPEKQAAAYRQRLRDTEAELATARDEHAAALGATRAELDKAHELLSGTRQAIFDHELARAGLPKAVAVAAGVTIDTFLDPETGMPDREAMGAAIETAIDNNNIAIPGRPRRPDPVPALGRGAPEHRPSDSERFASTFRPR